MSSTCPYLYPCLSPTSFHRLLVVTSAIAGCKQSLLEAAILSPMVENKKHARAEDGVVEGPESTSKRPRPQSSLPEAPIKSARSQSTESSVMVERSRSKPAAPPAADDKIPSKATSPVHPTGTAPSKSPNKLHRIKLVFKTISNEKIGVCIKEKDIRKVASYCTLLEKQIRAHPNASVITVVDPTVYPDETVTDMLLFLEDGSVDPPDEHTPDAVRKHWYRLIRLWFMGAGLGVEGLDHAITARMSLRKLPLGLFTDLARIWFRWEDERMHKDAGSMNMAGLLPLEMRAVVHERLQDMIDNGFDRAIIPERGLFLTIFTECLVVQHRLLRGSVQTTRAVHEELRPVLKCDDD